MRPLTTYQPKVMLPLANHPLLEHLLLAVRDAGIQDVILVVGYGEESVRTYFKDGKDCGLHIRYVKQPRQKGTADALLSVQGLIRERFLTLNGDMILASDDIRTLIEQGGPCMATFQSDHPEDFGVVVVEEGYIRDLVEKSPGPPSSLINAGAYLLDPDIFDQLKAIPLSERGEYELTKALHFYIEQHSLRAHHLSSWLDIGYPWDLLEVNARMCSSLEPVRNGIIEQHVNLHGSVSLGEGSVLKSGTYIEGPCVIGRNCVIGPHAFIRGATSIGNGCHIGHSTEIKNSLIMEGTKIPHFNYVGDSVVGRGCNFGAGTKVANLRHDHGPVWVSGKNTTRVKFGAVVGDHVRIGINCSINVGSVLGSNSRFGPGVLIDGSYGDRSRIR
jgi:bifunctional UDP-N-acetylglucosamine pyrophosphorylase/glucosamine-1-phosphate N-acetyltransferase